MAKEKGLPSRNGTEAPPPGCTGPDDLSPQENDHKQERVEHQQCESDVAAHCLVTVGYCPSSLSLKKASTMSPATVASDTVTSSPWGERRMRMSPFRIEKMMFSPTRKSPVCSCNPDCAEVAAARVSASDGLPRDARTAASSLAAVSVLSV